MGRGGYRPGAGRPKGAKGKSVLKEQKAPKAPKVPADIAAEAAAVRKDPLTYMLDVLNDSGATTERRDRMAVAAAPFVHPRKGEGQGKKDEQADKAKKAGAGKFAAGAAPVRLVK